MSQAAVPDSNEFTELPIEYRDEHESIKITGFWMFLVTDMLIFGSLFATYAVYHNRTAGGPSGQTLFQMGPVFAETLLLLTSSFTVGMAIYYLRRANRRATAAWLVATMALGAGFVALELNDFFTYAASGAGWHVSAFLSSFYLLVATHGFHVTFGILWATTLLFQLLKRGPADPKVARKLFTFSLYWHFLDIVWVFIFSYVYLAGHLGHML